MDRIIRVNAGCGMSAIKGWHNYDNSFSVFLAHHTVLRWLCGIFPVLTEDNRKFIGYAMENNVLWADLSRRIPLPSGCADVIYTSHMLEHFTHVEVAGFLAEARRVLVPDGIIRIVVPDIQKLINQYNLDNDANGFLGKTLLSHEKPKTLKQRFRYLFVGRRGHFWLYNAASMKKLLLENGFRNVSELAPGNTLISDPAGLNLYERQDESLYMEAQA